MVELQGLINDIADTLVAIDSSGVPFKEYQPGVGPYGEPQLLTEVARRLDAMAIYHGVRTKRTPDLLIPGQWALEFKIARPFGNNGKPAENWSVNLLHPYPGNVSTIGDCFKLQALQSEERKAIAVIGYEHDPPKDRFATAYLVFRGNSPARNAVCPRSACRRAAPQSYPSRPSTRYCLRVGGVRKQSQAAGHLEVSVRERRTRRGDYRVRSVAAGSSVEWSSGCASSSR